MKKLITTFLILCIMLFMASCGENAGSAEGKNCESYTPTPEFWAKFDAEGITDEMVFESVHHGAIQRAENAV